MDINKFYDKEKENIFISPSGLTRLVSLYDQSNPMKNIEWTTDFSIELPIKLKKQGPGF